MRKVTKSDYLEKTYEKKKDEINLGTMFNLRVNQSTSCEMFLPFIFKNTHRFESDMVIYHKDGSCDAKGSIIVVNNSIQISANLTNAILPVDSIVTCIFKKSVTLKAL